MKLFIASFFIISQVFAAHQYIQCSSTNTDTTDMAVISLSESKNTLFLSSGVGNPEEIRVLKEISEELKTDTHLILKSENNETRERVTIPLDVLGKRSDFFHITLELTQLANNNQAVQDFSCYTRLYNEQ